MDLTNLIERERINQVEKIKEIPEIKKLISENEEYVNKIKQYDFSQLMNELQPKWSNQKFLNETDGIKLSLLMLEYRSRGFDPEYFTCGVGSYIKQSNDNNRCILC